MPIYTVHEPPAKAGEDSPDPARFAFVRDGFSFWAFLLTGLWMAWHRLWLVLIGYIAVSIALPTLVYLSVGPGSVMLATGFLLSLLVGFEAATLRRFTLARRGWKTAGIVVGEDAEAAERRFFDVWITGNGGRPAAPAGMMLPRRASEASEVIGLFPAPGAQR